MGATAAGSLREQALSSVLRPAGRDHPLLAESVSTTLGQQSSHSVPTAAGNLARNDETLEGVIDLDAEPPQGAWCLGSAFPVRPVTARSDARSGQIPVNAEVPQRQP